MSFRALNPSFVGISLLSVIFISLILAARAHAHTGNETDRLSLLAFKSQIHLDPHGAMSSWNDSVHFCLWGGVKCGKKHRRVTALDLRSKGLVGSLSPYLGNLSFLRDINVGNNSLEGEIPPAIGCLFRLESLRLENNSLEGTIPANLSHCANLKVLSAGYNKLGNKIPWAIGTLKNLRVLYLSKNNLQGEIPSSLGNLTSLEKLVLADNKLEGHIPHVLGHLKNLNVLALCTNKLHGIIPLSIYNLSSLTVFSFCLNQLSGNLPPNLGLYQLPNLQLLELFVNQFAGPLPLSLSNASELRSIDISDNRFRGKVPTSFGRLEHLQIFNIANNYFGSGETNDLDFFKSIANWTMLELVSIEVNRFGGILPKLFRNISSHLRYFGIAQNQISGVIPSDIVNLANIDILKMQQNRLTGDIPYGICKVTNLQVLYIQENQLSGPIPSCLGNLSFLSYVSLDNNKLEGNIPPSLGNCPYLLWLSLWQNNLTGTIPKSIFLSSALITIYLDQNYLIGSIPLEVANLKQLVWLSVGQNFLSGELPAAIGECSSLMRLYLSTNFFQGSIPPSWASLKSIEFIDLSSNNLSGLIPKFLENFPLQNLNLSFNNFEGELPTKGAFGNASAIVVLGNRRICGGIPGLGLPRCVVAQRKGRILSKVHFILIAVACAILSMAVVFTCIIWLKFIKRKKRVQPPGVSLEEKILKVSYQDLIKATDAFSTENLIGMGSFGSVYKGFIDQLETIVAVKVFNLMNKGAYKSFTAECEALRKIRHRNLVKIITSCSSIDFQGNDFRALVYEFMPNGSLERWLHSGRETDDNGDRENRTVLNLHQRVDIAADVACALDYLHKQCGNPIVHCDIKPSNILLDTDMVARVSDFGIAKFLLSEISTTSQSSSIGVRGTPGYVPPEYGVGCQVSTSGDVYSYGILLLEMITGKSPVDPMFQEGLTLHNYAKMALPDHVMKIVDPMLLSDGEEDLGKRKECLICFLKIGVACSLESPHDRMKIQEIIHQLLKVKRILQATQN